MLFRSTYLRHRQTKGAATDMFGLPPLRHTPTLPKAVGPAGIGPSAQFEGGNLLRRNGGAYAPRSLNFQTGDAEPLGFVGQVVLDAGTTPGLPRFSHS